MKTVEVFLEPSHRMRQQANSVDYDVSTTDFPPKYPVSLPGIPRVGDQIYANDSSGRTWEVIRVNWGIDAKRAVIEVE